MYYTDLKTALSSLTPGVTWPDPPATNAYFHIIPPSTTPSTSRPRVTLLGLETALGGWLSDNPFTSLVNALPSELGAILEKLQSELTIAELGVATGAPDQGQIPVSAFNFTLALDMDPAPTVGGLSLTAIGLELNLVEIGGALAWNPILVAACTFLGVDCAFSMGLRGRSFTLTLSETAGASVDAILSAASSGTSLESLQNTMGVKSTGGGTPEIELFMVNAELSSDTPTLSCALVLADFDLTWQAFSLSKAGIAFEHGGDDTDFSFMAAASIGGIEVDGALSYDTATKSTNFQGALSTIGSGLDDFLTTLASEVDIPNPLPGLSDVELTGLSVSLTDVSGRLTFEITCGGSIAFDTLGTSLRFEFSFDRPDTGDVNVALKLDRYIFTLDEADGNLIFSYSGSEKLPLTTLVELAQLYPLYGLTNDIELTLEDGVLALVPETTGPGNHILFGARFSLGATATNSLFGMITGSDGIGIDTVTLLAANDPWSMVDLTAISAATSLPLTAPVPQGISLASALNMGRETSGASLTPPNTNNAPSQTPAPAEGVASPNAARWFSVQKQLGPVYLDRVGVGLNASGDGASIDLLCDASFILGPLTIALDGFTIDVPYATPADFTVYLESLSLSYYKPPLSISGGFLDKGNDLFLGDLLVQSSNLFLSAIGEYGDENGHTSLSLFAALTDPPLGGPVFCYITGLAAGGGYNTALNIPTTASEVPDFALIKAAAGGVPVTDPFDVLAECVSPRKGDDWLAVGLIFRSFELIESTALLTASFGQNLQFAILGQSEISIPPASAHRIAYAQVDVEASYVPSTEALDVFGVLTENSYVLSPDCHIQGGFAYVLKTSGDFIISYGGYAPHFNYAALGYPAVSRLTMQWRIDSHTNVTGTAYFALTPAAMMAGGYLEATWDCGIFSAWFDVGVDFLIEWRPFYYQADFTMSLGVGFDLKILFVHVHFTFHVGASLAIEGPPFHGSAHIDLDIVSFTIDFGPSVNEPPALSWEHFRALLPGQAGQDASDSAVLAVKVTDGLNKDLTQSQSQLSLTGSSSEQKPDWVVNGTHFCFDIQSSVPITEAASGSVTIPPAPATIGILPMDVGSATGMLDVTITDSDGKIYQTDTAPTSRIVVEAIVSDMPAAYWGVSRPDNANADPLQLTSGYRIYGGKPTPDASSSVELSILLFQSDAIAARSDRAASAQPFPDRRML